MDVEEEAKEARRRVIAAQLEQPLVVGPRRAVEVHEVILLRRVVPIEELGACNHENDYSPGNGAPAHAMNLS